MIRRRHVTGDRHKGTGGGWGWPGVAVAVANCGARQLLITLQGQLRQHLQMSGLVQQFGNGMALTCCQDGRHLDQLATI